MMCCIFQASSQPLFTKSYGGTTDDYGYVVKALDDGGMILTGRTLSFGQGSYDYSLTRLDSAGNVLWSRTYGTSGYEEARDVEVTPDGGFIVTGQYVPAGSATGAI